ncbi:MAG: autotransporter domain-containing protein [Thiobacillus sp.]|nr:autotransporter domain-containing protein [Thiobacillus sp.]
MPHRHTRLATALAAAGLVALAQSTHADGSLTGLNYLPGSYSAGASLVCAEGLALSDDGLVVAGKQSVGCGATVQAARFTSDGVQALALPAGTTTSAVQGASADGTTLVGWGNVGSPYTSALVWEGGGVGILPDLSNTIAASQAWAVSDDGTVAAGTSHTGSVLTGYHAVRWIKSGGTWGAPEDIHGGGFTMSFSRDLDATGTTVVGYGGSEVSQYVGSTLTHVSGYTEEAFRWTAAGGMAGLGVLTSHDTPVSAVGYTARSRANAVSADGLVVVGESRAAGDSADIADSILAFRWTQAGGMVSLGTLAGGKYSIANDVNADGSVIVGNAGMPIPAVPSIQGGYAFRWTEAGGMQYLGDWLAGNGVTVGDNSFTTAVAVDASGNVVMGKGQINGITQTYVARVAGATGGGDTGGGDTGGGGTGVIGLDDFMATMASVARTVGLPGEIARMTFFGAHHRPLADNGLPAGGCLWATGDLGGSGDRRQDLAEFGVCGDFGAWRLGAGLGASRVGDDLALGGEADYDGRHLYLEADYRLGDRLLASLAGFYGGWDADIKRNYLNGATVETARGDTDVRAWALRVRLDWLDAASLGRFSLSPFAAYSHGRGHTDGYAETGGAFPVTYADASQTSRELRLGLGARNALSADTDLRLSAEAIHRFDSDAAITFDGGAGIGSRTVAAPESTRNRARFGIEVDHRVDTRSLLSASLHASTGGDTAWLGSVSWKRRF